MNIVGVVKYGATLAVAITALVGLSPLCNQAEARRHTRSSAHSSSTSSRHHGRHHTTKHHATAQSKPRYAYALDMLMMEAPPQDLSLLPSDEALKIRYAFQSGTADHVPPNLLIRSGAVNYYPLHGGILERREEVKYIVVHSTETGVPQDARHVINAWSSGGRRHPGAQFIVDRDGTIFETVDPKYATVHVNIFKTLPGINNDNTIGIEMCHTGSQDYPPEQRAAVTRLVTYLQDRFHVVNDNVITHRYAQQGDHTDPVNFNFEEFLARKDDFHNKALAMRHEMPAVDNDAVTADIDAPPAAVYLEMHHSLKPEDIVTSRTFSIPETQKRFPGIPDTTPQQAIQGISTARNALPIRGEIELAPDAAGQLGLP
ncbi:MAG TPA: peptidoglycan recognition family protein [Candidatus Obscuribacterales bacterium]